MQDWFTELEALARVCHVDQRAKGVVTMSQHKYMQVGDGVPNAGTFYAMCRVASN
jgi:hypothetical protein